MPFFKQYLNTLPENQRKALLQLTQQKRSAGFTSEEAIEDEMQSRLEQIQNNKNTPSYTHRNQTDRISSSSFNAELESLYVDLNTLFGTSIEMSSIIHDHLLLNRSGFKQTHQKLDELNNLCNLYEAMLGSNEDYIHPILITFSSYREEKDPKFYRDMPKAHVDVVNHTLSLPLYTSHNRIKHRNGSVMAELKASSFSGRPLLKNSNTTEEAIGGNPNTFWGEVVLSTSPIITNDSIGAEAIMDLIFDYAAPLSELVFVPFGEFPIELTSVQLFSDTSEVYPIASIIPDYYQNIETTEPIHLNFPQQHVKRVQFTIRQRHSTMQHYYVNPSNLKEHRIRNKTRQADNNGTFLDGEMTGIYPNWDTYQDSMKIWSASIDEMSYANKESNIIQGVRGVIPTNSDVLLRRAQDLLGNQMDSHQSTDASQITRYETIYGLYDLQAHFNVYQSYGTFISKPLDVKGDVRQMQLSVKEEVPIIEGIPCGSIQWDIGNNDNWKPLLPQGVTEQWERIFPDGNGEATTRFSHVLGSSAKLYVDHKEVPYSIATNAEGKLVVNIKREHQSKSLVMNYSADMKNSTLDFKDWLHPQVIEETFGPEQEVSQERVLRLKHYPFVDYGIVNDPNNSIPIDGKHSLYTDSGNFLKRHIYNPIRIEIDSPSLLNTNQTTLTTRDAILDAGTHISLENRTNYVSQRSPALKPAAVNAQGDVEYQYRHNQKIITLGDPHNQATIKVSYHVLTQDIRIRATIYNHLPSYTSMTPRVIQCVAKPRVMNLF